MPDINEFDSEDKWNAACIPAMIDEGKPQEQAVAACMSMWREKGKADKAGRRLRGDWLQKLKEMRAAFSDWLKNLGDIESWADYADEPVITTKGTESKAANMADWLESKIHQTFTNLADELLQYGNVTRDERIGLSGLIGDALDTFHAGLTGAQFDALRIRRPGEEAASAEMASEATLTTKGSAPLLFTTKAGDTWLLTWTTNAFIDRDLEMFSTKSIEEYVARHENDAVKGEYQLWHMPATKFGEIKWQGMIGRFLAEAGPFDKTPIGEQFKAFFESHPDGHPEFAPSGWATSHGYSYKEGDRADGVYDWFDKHETSVLPFEAAANQHNPQPEVLSMNDKQKGILREIGGDALVAAVIATGEAQTKALEEQGVAFKAETEKVEPAVAEPAAPALDIKAISDGLHLPELEAAIKGLVEKMTGIETVMGELKQADEKRIAEKMANVPRFSWFRGSQAAGTVLDATNPTDAALKARKAPPAAITNIAAKMQEQHGG